DRDEEGLLRRLRLLECGREAGLPRDPGLAVPARDSRARKEHKGACRRRLEHRAPRSVRTPTSRTPWTPASSPSSIGRAAGARSGGPKQRGPQPLGRGPPLRLLSETALPALVHLLPRVAVRADR